MEATEFLNHYKQPGLMDKWGHGFFEECEWDDFVRVVGYWMEKFANQRERDLREEMLLQFGDFMWRCSDSDYEYDRDLAIGFDDNGMPDSVSLEIFGRSHSDFKFKPKKK